MVNRVRQKWPFGQPNLIMSFVLNYLEKLRILPKSKIPRMLFHSKDLKQNSSMKQKAFYY